MKKDQIIIHGYARAGDDFLAHKLRKVFTLLKTPEDMALHNDMIRDIQSMIGDVGANDLRRSTAGMLINRSENFLLRVANRIKNLSVRNMQNDQENQKS